MTRPSSPDPTMNGRALGGTVNVDRRSLHTFRAELAQERQVVRRLQLELTAEVALARRATEETLAARAEREEYRRVLAAAIANEKRSNEELARVRAECARIEERLVVAERARGEAAGRTRELERRLLEQDEQAARELAEVKDRAWSDREAGAQERQRLAHERGLALGQVRELSKHVVLERPESARVAEWRSRLCFASAAFCATMFLLFLTPLVLALFAADSGTWPSAAAGLSAWRLLLLEVVWLGAGLGLLSQAVRDRRAAELASQVAAEQAAAERAAVDSAEPAA
ncbi:MAG: hypothetical protein O2816_07260 [Planctomycetota bacterium]|nr:hypothetical protein [Planctomycetota bacterium]